MTLLQPDSSVFVLIDVQGKLVDQVHESARLLEVCHRLLQIADAFDRPVVLTEQYPKGLGSTDQVLLDRFDHLAVAKARVEKDSFGCCAEPSFEHAVSTVLPGVGFADRHYIVAGMETHICVMQTVLALREQGATVFVPFDGVSGRGAQYHSRGLDRMERAGAVLTNHESIGFELAGDKNHRSFKTLSTLLKAGQPGSASA